MKPRHKRADGVAIDTVLSSRLAAGGPSHPFRSRRAALRTDPKSHHRVGFAQRLDRNKAFVVNSLSGLDVEEKFLWETLNVLLLAFESSGLVRDDPNGVHETTMQKRLMTKWKIVSLSVAPGLEGCMKFVKYKLAAFFSVLTGQDLPPCPFPKSVHDNPMQVVSGARAKRFVQSLFRDESVEGFARRLTVAVNILQAKKGLPRPDKAMLEKAAKKTFDELTSPAPFRAAVSTLEASWADEPEEDHSDLPVSVDWSVIEREINRTVDELYPDGEYSVRHRIEPFFPSTSANYIASRSNAGAVGALLQEYPVLLEGLRSDANGGISFSAAVVPESISARTNELSVDSSVFRQNFEDFYFRLCLLAEKEIPAAVPVSLAEALKVRVITKGPALLNTALKPLQKYLHGVLAKHRCFQLVGRPVTERILLDVLGATLAEDQSYLSGDYSNATNELNRRTSELVARALARRLRLSDLERDLLLRSLTGHVLEHDGELRMQQNGQLMGSVTSFPVLCIANFAICRLAMEFGSRMRLSTASLPLLVNGDDCLFRTNERGRRLWSLIGAFIGLSPSVGKCFWSREFCNVNSTNFYLNSTNPRSEEWKRSGAKSARCRVCPDPPSALTLDKDKCLRMNPFFETRFVNFGLLMGLKRSGGSVGMQDVFDPIDGLGVRQRELLRTCPLESLKAVRLIFWRQHLDLLKKTNVPWFLPEWIGGLGLLVDDEGDTQDELSLRCAFYALTNWKDMSYRPQAIRADAPWRVRKHVQDQLEALGLPTVTLDSAQSEAEDRVFGLLCAATLFDSRTKLSDLFKEPETENLKDAPEKGQNRRHALAKNVTREASTILRRNERFWRWLSGRGGHNGPHTRSLPELEPSDPEGLTRAQKFFQSLLSMRPPRAGYAFVTPKVDFSSSESLEYARDMSLARSHDYFQLNWDTAVRAALHDELVQDVERGVEVLPPQTVFVAKAVVAVAPKLVFDFGTEVKKPALSPWEDDDEEVTVLKGSLDSVASIRALQRDIDFAFEGESKDSRLTKLYSMGELYLFNQELAEFSLELEKSRRFQLAVPSARSHAPTDLDFASEIHRQNYLRYAKPILLSALKGFPERLNEWVARAHAFPRGFWKDSAKQFVSR